jgi:hypothetical protein
MEQPKSQDNNENKEIIDSVNKAVSELLVQLSEYNRIETKNSQRIDELTSSTELFKQSGKVVGRGAFASPESKAHLANVQELKRLKGELQDAGDIMKYQNPAIWLMYKAVAYEGSAKENKTIGDFVVHTEVDTICNARLMFLDLYLNKIFNKSFHNFDNSISLRVFAVSDTILSLVKDKDFMTKWSKWENYEVAGYVDKWNISIFPDFKKDKTIRSQFSQHLLI